MAGAKTARGSTRSKPKKEKQHADHAGQAQMVRQASTPVINTGISAPNENLITNHQSMEIIQTLLYSALSSVLYFRSQLPSDMFKKMHYASINKHCSYEDFTSADNDRLPRPGERRPPGECMSILKRGACRQGDQIIHCLEFGVFEALKLGYVQELQFSILHDPKEPSKVLEHYSFAFRYADNGQGGGPRLADIEMTNPQGSKVTLMDARKALNTVVKSMIELNGQMPTLPSQHFALMYLVYNERKPKGYRAPGFIPSTDADASISFPNNGWELETVNCGEVNTSFRSARLQVSFVSHNEFRNDDEEGAVVLPTHLQYGPISDRTEPMQGMMAVPGSSTSQLNDKNSLHHDLRSSVEQEMPVSTLTNLKQQVRPLIPVTIERHTGKSSDHRLSVTEPNTGTNTQEVVEKEAVQKMLQPPIRGDDVVETQVVPTSKDPLQRFQFTQNVIDDLGSAREEALSTRKTQVGQEGSESESINCQCGSLIQEGIMIACSLCDNWQHAHCYGYTAASIGKLPEEHFCYSCLLEKKDSSLFMEMERLALIRRILHTLEQQSFDSESHLAAAMGLKRVEIAGPLKELTEQEFTSKVKVSKKARSATKITLNQSQRASQGIREQYFDPTKHIEHYMALPRSGPVRALPSRSSLKRPNDAAGVGEPDPKTPRLSKYGQSVCLSNQLWNTPSDHNYL